MMRNEDIFELALNLSAPWQVIETKLAKPNGLQHGQLDIYFDFIAGSKFPDEAGNLCSVYDTSERSWQHLNFFEHKCYLRARVPRITAKSGKVKTVAVPWARPGSGLPYYSKRFL